MMLSYLPKSGSGDVKKFTKSRNYQFCSRNAVRVHSGIKNLAHILMVFKISRFLMVSSFFYNLDIKKLIELEFINPILGCCQVTIKFCKSSVQV